MAKRTTKHTTKLERNAADEKIRIWRSQIEACTEKLREIRAAPEDERLRSEWYGLEQLRLKLIAEWRTDVKPIVYSGAIPDLFDLFDQISPRPMDFLKEEISESLVDESLRSAMDYKEAVTDPVKRAMFDRYIRRVEVWMANPMDSGPPVPIDPHQKQFASPLISLCYELHNEPIPEKLPLDHSHGAERKIEAQAAQVDTANEESIPKLDLNSAEWSTPDVVVQHFKRAKVKIGRSVASEKKLREHRRKDRQRRDNEDSNGLWFRFEPERRQNDQPRYYLPRVVKVINERKAKKR